MLNSKNSTEAGGAVLCDVSGFWLIHTDTKAIDGSKSRDTTFFMACIGRKGWLYSLSTINSKTFSSTEVDRSKLRLLCSFNFTANVHDVKYEFPYLYAISFSGLEIWTAPSVAIGSAFEPCEPALIVVQNLDPFNKSLTSVPFLEICNKHIALLTRFRTQLGSDVEKSPVREVSESSKLQWTKEEYNFARDLQNPTNMWFPEAPIETRNINANSLEDVLGLDDNYFSTFETWSFEKLVKYLCTSLEGTEHHPQTFKKTKILNVLKGLYSSFSWKYDEVKYSGSNPKKSKEVLQSRMLMRTLNILNNQLACAFLSKSYESLPAYDFGIRMLALSAIPFDSACAKYLNMNELLQNKVITDAKSNSLKHFVDYVYWGWFHGRLEILIEFFKLCSRQKDGPFLEMFFADAGTRKEILLYYFVFLTEQHYENSFPWTLKARDLILDQFKKEKNPLVEKVLNRRVTSEVSPSVASEKSTINSFSGLVSIFCKYGIAVSSMLIYQPEPHAWKMTALSVILFEEAIDSIFSIFEKHCHDMIFDQTLAFVSAAEAAAKVQ